MNYIFEYMVGFLNYYEIFSENKYFVYKKKVRCSIYKMFQKIFFYMELIFMQYLFFIFFVYQVGVYCVIIMIGQNIIFFSFCRNSFIYCKLFLKQLKMIDFFVFLF